KRQQRRLERAVQREQVQLAAQRIFGGIGAYGLARQGRSWRRRGVEYRGPGAGVGPDMRSGGEYRTQPFSRFAGEGLVPNLAARVGKEALLPFTGEGARRACPRESGGRMRGRERSEACF